MPLGLKDSDAVIQWCIRETLENFPGSIPYIDDVLVYGKMQQEHDCNLEWVLQALHSRSFHLQLPKCLFPVGLCPLSGSCPIREGTKAQRFKKIKIQFVAIAMILMLIDSA